MYQDELQPPQALDAERAVLGCILKSGSMDKVISILPDSIAFYAPKHRKVYNAMRRLFDKSEPIDIPMVAGELMGELADIGGRVYLVELVEPIASTANAPVYAKAVIDKYTRRQVISSCGAIIKSAYETELGTPALIDDWQRAASRIGGIGISGGFERLSATSDDIRQLIDDFQTGNYDNYCVKTGFPNLDRAMLGIPYGELCTIAGRTGSGKTQLALQIAKNRAATGRSVAILSLEMAKKSLGLRLLCSEALIDSGRVRRKGMLSDSELKRLNDAQYRLDKMGIYVDPNAATTPQQLIANARRLKKKDPSLDLVIVDYLQLMTGSEKNLTREREVGMMSRNMKLLAMSVPNLAVIQLSQLNREADKENANGEFPRPRLRMLRESGSIEQDSGLVIFIHRTGRGTDTDPERHWVIIGKDREGNPGIDVEFAFPYGQWAEIDNIHKEA